MSECPPPPVPEVVVEEMLMHLESVIRFARSLARNRDDAADLVQATYLRAFRRWETYQRGTNARPWLFTICRNIYLREQSRDRRLVNVESDPELDVLASVGLHAAAQRGGYDDVFERVDLEPAIEAAIAALPDDHRIVVGMVDIEGRSYAEVAEMLGVPIGTVRSRLFRARRVLQEQLIDFARDAGLVSASGAAT
jgi:RNA polymerase sigma-70 factor, ECF subfamily